MRKFILLLPSLFILCSCEMDDNGDFHLTWLFWFFVVVFFAMFVAIAIKSDKDQKKVNLRLKKLGIDPASIIRVGKYVGGHPEIDNNIEVCSIYQKNEDLIICEVRNDLFPYKKSKIKIDTIKNIQVEDASSLEKKVTLGRVLLVGVFALAWKKNKKDEHAFVSIDWTDGKFEHTTIFAFEGKDAMQKANTARNSLIKIAR